MSSVNIHKSSVWLSCPAAAVILLLPQVLNNRRPAKGQRARGCHPAHGHAADFRWDRVLSKLPKLCCSEMLSFREVGILSYVTLNKVGRIHRRKSQICSSLMAKSI